MWFFYRYYYKFSHNNEKKKDRKIYTKEERKQIKIAEESQRREKINKGFIELQEQLPKPITINKISKAALLHKDSLFFCFYFKFQYLF